MQPNSETLARILSAGQAEFLSKGFKGASLRKIAAAAGVTTGAIYGYYPDKESLFNALVEEPARRVLEQFQEAQGQFDALPGEVKVRSMLSYSRDAMANLMDYVYENITAFKLIVCCSEGTQYAAYLDKIIAIEEHYTLRFLDALRETGHPVPDISPQVIHILCSACYSGMFEVVTHDIPRERAAEHVEVFTDFFKAGWVQILQLE